MNVSCSLFALPIRCIKAAMLIAVAFASPVLPFKQGGSQRSPDILPPSIASQVRIDTRKPIDFHATVWPDTVYVNQQLYHQVGVFLHSSARGRLAGNPEFIPPEFRGMITYEMAIPRNNTEANVNGTGYDAHVFHRAMFPVTSGKLSIPSPQLNYRLRASNSYFSREVSSFVRAESLAVVVLPLPTAGRPTDFSGAVGRYRSITRIDSRRLKVGDPAILTLRVEGSGNIKLLTRPPIEIPWATIVAGSERISVDTAGMLVRGAREFDWIFTPTVAGTAVVPQVSYVYFDPYAKAYAEAKSDSLIVSVADGVFVSEEEAESGLLSLSRDAIGETGFQQRVKSFAASQPMALWPALLLCAPIPAILLLLSRHRVAKASKEFARSAKAVNVAGSNARSHDVRESSAASASGLAASNARAARKRVHETLAQRLGVSLQELTNRNQVGRLLRKRGATRETTKVALQLLERLDRAAFSEHGLNDFVNDAVNDKAVDDVLTKISLETVEPTFLRKLTRLSRGAMFLFAANVGDVATVQDAPLTTASRSEFEAAAVAYQQRSFVESALRFRSLAEQNPESVDILVNWGTAAWTLGDTVDAVVAWHRAARLNPTAADIQERIQLLPSGSKGGVATVPLLVPELLLATSVGVWIVSWLLLAAIIFWSSRSGNAANRVAVSVAQRATLVVALLAFVTGAYAWKGVYDKPLDTLYVVSRPDILRVNSSIDADAMGGVATGDIVKRSAVDGDRVRVTHSDGRTGWLSASRIVPIASQHSGD